MSPEHHEPKPGIRAIDLDIEVPGTPEEVWEAVASGPGITAWFVPAKVEGVWQTAKGELSLKQEFQTITGTLAGAPIESVKIHGDQLGFTAGGAEYSGRVNGNTITGVVKTGGSQTAWTAKKNSSGL